MISRLATILFWCFAIQVVALGIAAAQTSGDQTVVDMIMAFKGGQWLMVAAAAITLLTRLVTYIADKLKPDWWPKWLTPWLSAGLAMVGAVITAMVQGQDIWMALVLGLVVGNAASGFWSMVGKYALTKSKKEAPNG